MSLWNFQQIQTQQWNTVAQGPTKPKRKWGRFNCESFLEKKWPACNSGGRKWLQHATTRYWRLETHLLFVGKNKGLSWCSNSNQLGWPLARLWLTLSAAESFVSAKESTASSASSRSLRHHLDQHAAASTDLCCLGYQWYLQSRLGWIYMESRGSKRWRKRCFCVLPGASSTCIAPTMKACRCPGSKHRWTQSGSLIAASSASLSRTKATHCQSFLGTLLSQLLQIGQQLQKQSTWTVEKRAEEPKLWNQSAARRCSISLAGQEAHMCKHVTCMSQVSTALFTACFEGVEHPTANMVAPHLPCPAFSNVLSMASYAMASTSVLNAKRRTQQDHMSNSVYSHGLSWLAPAYFRATSVATTLYIMIIIKKRLRLLRLLRSWELPILLHKLLFRKLLIMQSVPSAFLDWCILQNLQHFQAAAPSALKPRTKAQQISLVSCGGMNKAMCHTCPPMVRGPCFFLRLEPCSFLCGRSASTPRVCGQCAHVLGGFGSFGIVQK